jgi:hypothetical protein
MMSAEELITCFVCAESSHKFCVISVLYSERGEIEFGFPLYCHSVFWKLDCQNIEGVSPGYVCVYEKWMCLCVKDQ